VPADYERIRDENVARYGWDTAVLDLLGHLYSERTHFIFELIQNAEDAGATALAFELFDDRLEVRHDGRPFTEADVRGVSGVGQSGKSGDLTTIGQFGIGFKSVYAYTKTPRVHSGAEHFRIDHYVRPSAVDPVDGDSPQTLFVFPFDLGTVPAATAVREIAAALDRIEPETLLFLRNITRLRAHGTGLTSSGAAGTVIERRTQPRAPASQARAGRHITLTRSQGGRDRTEDWFAWDRPLDHLGHAGQQVELAFRADTTQREPRLLARDRSPLVVFFPTEKETFLGFLIQGPYRTTPARDNVPGDDPANQALVRETAVLLTDVLRDLRDAGLLTVEVLAALPLDPARFPPGSMLAPLFDAVRTALTEENLIPTAGGGYAAARNLKLASTGGVRELLAPGQLGALFQADLPLAFAQLPLGGDQFPRLRHYLREEIGVGEVTPANLLTRATRGFLEAQPDEWIIRFYGFLHAEPDLWREPRLPDDPPGPARTRPVIRLEDGRQAEPFDAEGRPAAYLPADYQPGPAGTGFPTVRRTVAEAPAARAFLEALGFTEPDIVSEVLEIILPRYARLARAAGDGPAGDGLSGDGLSGDGLGGSGLGGDSLGGVAALDRAQHAADLDLIIRAMDEVDPGRHSRLLDQLRETAFLIGENAASGAQRLMPPPALYQRSRDLEIYLDGNTGAWFAADVYGPWLAQLRAMGVRDQVDVQARAPGPLGHVLLVAGFARHERGLDGFDPEARIDGLEFALQHPGHARAEFVWNVLLAPNRRLIGGVVEKSVREGFADSRTETVQSAAGQAAAAEAWLPGPDGLFHRPADLSLDDLPPTFARDEGLAQSLGMSQPVVSQAGRRLGIPPEVLWGLSAHPDLVAMIEGELKLRTAGQNPLDALPGPGPAEDRPPGPR
jgi:hypothetical protein